MRGRGLPTAAWIFPALKVAVTESHSDRETTYPSPAYGGTYHLGYPPQVKNYVKRHYNLDTYWNGFGFRDFELTKFEMK